MFYRHKIVLLLGSIPDYVNSRYLHHFACKLQKSIQPTGCMRKQLLEKCEKPKKEKGAEVLPQKNKREAPRVRIKILRYQPFCGGYANRF